MLTVLTHVFHKRESTSLYIYKVFTNKMEQNGHLAFYRLICSWRFVTIVQVGKTLPIKFGTEALLHDHFFTFSKLLSVLLFWRIVPRCMIVMYCIKTCNNFYTF